MKIAAQVKKDYPKATVYFTSIFFSMIKTGIIKLEQGKAYLHDGNVQTDYLVSKEILKLDENTVIKNYPYVCWYK